MDNRAIARHLRMMANLYEVADARHPLAQQYRALSNEIRTLPYALKDQLDSFHVHAKLPQELFNSLHKLIHSGAKIAFLGLPTGVPPTLRAVFALPEINPNVVRKWYSEYGITSLADLKAALQSGRLSDAHGLPSRVWNTLLMEVEKLERQISLVPLAIGQPFGRGWQEHLLTYPGVMRVEFTGELRRQLPLTTSVELLVAVTDRSRESVMQELLREGFTQRNARLDATMVELRMQSEVDDRVIPVCLYVTTVEDFYPCWVMTSGDEEHRNYLGVTDTDAWIASLRQARPTTEVDVYKASSRAYIEPELRERGSLRKDSRRFVTYAALQGDLHMHTTYSDGAGSLEEMVRGCIARGYQYMAITDHSKSEIVANGLSEDRLARQHEEVLRLREKYPEIVILHGTEVDIMPDATLDFHDDTLADLDLVVASIHTSLFIAKKEQTARILAAIESPHVDIVAHPTGRMLGRRDSYALDWDAIFAAAAAHHIALELNSNPNRLDLDPKVLRLALDAGCLFAIGSDAHSVNDLERIYLFGVTQARRAWLPTERVINAWNWETLSDWLSHQPNASTLSS